jgi:hypothetical protein
MAAIGGREPSLHAPHVTQPGMTVRYAEAGLKLNATPFMQ